MATSVFVVPFALYRKEEKDSVHIITRRRQSFNTILIDGEIDRAYAQK